MWDYESLEDIERSFGSVAEYNRRMEEESDNIDPYYAGIYEDFEYYEARKAYCKEVGHVINKEITRNHCEKHDCYAYHDFGSEEDSKEYICIYKECQFKK